MGASPRPPQSSPGMGQTHIPFREPHTQMRRGSSRSRGVLQTLTPLRVSRKAGGQSLSHPPYIRGWRGGSHTVPVRDGVRETGPLQLRCTPDPHIPQSEGTDTPLS